MLKHWNPITEEGGILVLQKLLHGTYDLIVVLKMVIMWMGFKFMKQEQGPSLVSKGDEVAIQSHSWLLQLLQFEQQFSFPLHFNSIASFSCLNSD